MRTAPQARTRTRTASFRGDVVALRTLESIVPWIEVRDRELFFYGTSTISQEVLRFKELVNLGCFAHRIFREFELEPAFAYLNSTDRVSNAPSGHKCGRCQWERIWHAARL
jgi:hypothetical protein